MLDSRFEDFEQRTGINGIARSLEIYCSDRLTLATLLEFVPEINEPSPVAQFPYSVQ